MHMSGAHGSDDDRPPCDDKFDDWKRDVAPWTLTYYNGQTHVIYCPGMDSTTYMELREYEHCGINYFNESIAHDCCPLMMDDPPSPLWRTLMVGYFGNALALSGAGHHFLPHRKPPLIALHVLRHTWQ